MRLNKSTFSLSLVTGTFLACSQPQRSNKKVARLQLSNSENSMCAASDNRNAIINLRIKAFENEMFTNIPFSALEFVRY